MTVRSASSARTTWSRIWRERYARPPPASTTRPRSKSNPAILLVLGVLHPHGEAFGPAAAVDIEFRTGWSIRPVSGDPLAPQRDGPARRGAVQHCRGFGATVDRAGRPRRRDITHDVGR